MNSNNDDNYWNNNNVKIIKTLIEKYYGNIMI